MDVLVMDVEFTLSILTGKVMPQVDDLGDDVVVETGVDPGRQRPSMPGRSGTAKGGGR